jgi:hypothetical protein
MSQKYTGGFITKSPVAPTSSAASGIWTLDQQQQAQKAGTWPSPPIFIEDLFSTYLYTGAGTTQTINNGVDLSAKGGLVWLKDRGNVGSHRLVDTVRGNRSTLFSDSTSAAVIRSDDVSCDVSSFNSNGFTAGNFMNQASNNYVSWTFREQPKFFDIVTYTGNGTNNRAISHSLGSTPGCVIVKRTDTASAIGWAVYHRGAAQNLALNLTDAQGNAFNADVKTPTSTTFTVSSYSDVNASGGTFVAYLFAHDAGGFPVSGGGSTNGISCGSFTPDAGGSATVTLGWEPQWILVKVSGTTGNWTVIDNMRDWSLGGNSTGSNDYLRPNTSGAELEAGTGFPTATGFFIDGVVAASQPHIYIAIRRGPMKVPTSGTSVYNAVARTGNNTNTNVTGVGFPVDWCLVKNRTGTSKVSQVYDRLRGAPSSLETWTTGAEASFATSLTSFALMDGVSLGDGNGVNQTGETYINYFYRRAPSFFDEVCYTGTGASSQVLTHNLTVTPQLTIFKKRSASNPWDVVSGNTSYLQLNDTLQAFPDTSIAATATTITAPLGAGNGLNASGATYVVYLFATCPGVSKVGTYTGNGTTQTINCGFAGGARFVLIKRTDSTGDWYVYDTTRGMTVLTDPYLLMNTDDVEVATLGSVTTVTTGFALDSTILAAINANGGTFIFLAIA